MTIQNVTGLAGVHCGNRDEPFGKMLVEVIDTNDWVKLRLTRDYPALLTPEEAEHIAHCLLAAAGRAKSHCKPPAKVKMVKSDG